MQLIVRDEPGLVATCGADIIAAVTAAKPDAAIVLATGNSPMGIYAELVARYQQGQFDARQLRIFQLDEYVGLKRDDDRTLYGWMDRSFLQPLRVPSEQVVRLDGGAEDLAAACRAYDDAVDDVGGFDLAVLGLGPNGHIGFNEPPACASTSTRVVKLSEASLSSNAAYWGGRERVPLHAVTAGISQLLSAKRVMLVVSGAAKRGILNQALYGPVTPDVPASYLQRAANLVVVADRAALPDCAAA